MDNKIDLVSPWHPMDNPVDLKHIGKLIEELTECGAAAARCMIQGIDESEPTTGKINRDWLEDEMADVLANIQLNINRFNLNETKISNRKYTKMVKLMTWHKMA
jgi:hypothetical protein